jgi:hypothetical protein
VVCFGLLPTLLFSSGEGIRLAPFPPVRASVTDRAERDTHPGRSYEKNVLRLFSSKSGNWAVKKNSPRSPLVSAAIKPELPRGSYGLLRLFEYHRPPSLLPLGCNVRDLCGREPPEILSSRVI